MTERSDIEDFFREIYPDLYQYAYAFCEIGFTSSIIVLLMANILSFQNKKFWVNILALRSNKLQMFDEQSCYVWQPIRACFGVTMVCTG